MVIAKVCYLIVKYFALFQTKLICITEALYNRWNPYCQFAMLIYLHNNYMAQCHRVEASAKEWLFFKIHKLVAIFNKSCDNPIPVPRPTLLALWNLG